MRTPNKKEEAGRTAQHKGEHKTRRKKTGNKITFFNLGEKNNFKNILEKNLVDEMSDYFKYQLKKYKYII